MRYTMRSLSVSVILSLLGLAVASDSIDGPHMVAIKHPSIFSSVADSILDCRGDYLDTKFCLLHEEQHKSLLNTYKLDIYSTFPVSEDLQNYHMVVAWHNAEQREGAEQTPALWKSLVQDHLSQMAIANEEQQIDGRIYFEKENLILHSVKEDHIDRFISLLPQSTSYLRLTDDAVVEPSENIPHDIRALASDPDPNIVKFINGIDREGQKYFVTYLTGEHQKSLFKTRHSTSDNITETAAWIQSQFASFGGRTEKKNFRPSYGPNVIAKFTGAKYPEEIVVIGAHYDSRAQNIKNANTRAPGANDDGSGTSLLLALAKVINDQKVKFARTVLLVAFCGEEQGLIGSSEYAKYLKSKNAKVTMMIQADMLAYRKNNEDLQVAFPKMHHTPSLSKLLAKVIATYIPRLKICSTNACCSDHQSFLRVGYAATALFERCGPIADDMYHNVGDVSARAGYDFEQLYLITQSMAASLATGAEIISIS